MAALHLQSVTRFLRTPVADRVCFRCPEHSLPYTYYCNSCSDAVCSDCALFSTAHKGHDFQHLRDVYALHSRWVVERFPNNFSHQALPFLAPFSVPFRCLSVPGENGHQLQLSLPLVPALPRPSAFTRCTVSHPPAG